eukprot:CAMPEP_0177694068 /NCGR_PEP_ID=MMETSP0484_2-20121128/2739_1 /TAXON_ID=354590 /ORGANISM="Rhodomonas lens, Strain RHODO" /LENGTH=259 /DNA_ID=CAMNT_0019204927 /DNA_START=65 /DNA_END=844 /DNA_ORIENTATION=-
MSSGDLSRFVREGSGSLRRPSSTTSARQEYQFPSLTEEMFEEIVPKTVRLPSDISEEFLRSCAWDGEGVSGSEVTYSLRNKVKKLLQQILRDKIAGSCTEVEKAGYLHSLGALIDDESKFSQAEPPLEKALKLRTASLGKDHRDTLFTSHLLGLVWMSQGSSTKLGKAEQILSATLETQTRVLGEDDPDTLRSMNGLGALHYTKGKHSEAEALYSKCLQKRQAVLGSAHKDTLATIHNLSLLYRGEEGHTAALLKLAFL